MALIKCPECEREISSMAESCPHCGYPIKTTTIKSAVSYNIILENCGYDYIKVIQKLRILLNCSLKEAKDYVDNVPSIIIRNVEYTKATALKNSLESLGARINIVDATGNKYVTEQIELDSTIRCFKCGSSQLSTDSKGFGLGKAAAGGLLLGPIGLLGGVLGSKKVMITCLKCGNKWEAGKD